MLLRPHKSTISKPVQGHFYRSLLVKASHKVRLQVSLLLEGVAVSQDEGHRYMEVWFRMPLCNDLITATHFMKESHREKQN